MATLAILIGAGAWALSGQNTPQPMQMAPDAEERFNGRLGKWNSSNNVHSEETKMIRPPGRNPSNPVILAYEVDQYQIKKNHILGEIFKMAGIHSHKGILQADKIKHTPLPRLMHPDGAQSDALRNYPTLTFERTNASMPEEDARTGFKDQYGHAGSNPKNGKPRRWPNQLVFGSPWGTGGLYALQLRSGMKHGDGFLPY